MLPSHISQISKIADLINRKAQAIKYRAGALAIQPLFTVGTYKNVFIAYDALEECIVACVDAQGMTRVINPYSGSIEKLLTVFFTNPPETTGWEWVKEGHWRPGHNKNHRWRFILL